jgi:hypothetical protein
MPSRALESAGSPDLDGLHVVKEARCGGGTNCPAKVMRPVSVSAPRWLDIRKGYQVKIAEAAPGAQLRCLDMDIEIEQDMSGVERHRERGIESSLNGTCSSARGALKQRAAQPSAGRCLNKAESCHTVFLSFRRTDFRSCSLFGPCWPSLFTTGKTGNLTGTENAVFVTKTAYVMHGG